MQELQIYGMEEVEVAFGRFNLEDPSKIGRSPNFWMLFTFESARRREHLLWKDNVGGG